MTVEVVIMIAGNKAVEIRTDAGPPVTCAPGQWVRQMLSGEQVLGIKEAGDALPVGKIVYVRDDEEVTPKQRPIAPAPSPQ
jgi:hypothetical protein